MEFLSLLESPIRVSEKLREHIFKHPGSISTYADKIGVSRRTLKCFIHFDGTTRVSMATLLKVINFLSRVS